MPLEIGYLFATWVHPQLIVNFADEIMLLD